MNHSDDDEYQDGIKLPMKNDKLEWEEIADEGLSNYKTHRMRVDGGYIYRYIHDDEAHLLFVANVPPKEREPWEGCI